MDPSPDAPSAGRVECSVEVWGALGGASGEALPPTRQAAADLGAELSAAVTRLVASRGAVDVGKLCVLPGRHVWACHVDLVVVAGGGGSLLDACALAALAALADTRMPRLRLVRSDGLGPGGKGEGEEVTAAEAAASPSSFDIELDDDPAAAVPFPAEDVPVVLTLTQLGGRDDDNDAGGGGGGGGVVVVDADALEEAAASGAAVVAVNRRGHVCALSADGPAGLRPAALHAAVEAARGMAPALFRKVDAALEGAGAGAGGGGEGAGGGSAAASRRGGFVPGSLLADVGTTVIGAENVVETGKGAARKGAAGGGGGGTR